MKLQAGKVYKARNGQVFGPVQSDNDPMCAIWTSEKIMWGKHIQPHWYTDGKVGSGLTMFNIYDSGFDLVKEVNN